MNACTLGATKQGQALVKKLAEIWGVPVSAGYALQNGGGYSRNQWGEWVPHAFAFEGDKVYTA